MILTKMVLLAVLGVALGLNVQPQPLPQQPIPADTLIMLRRTNCFYACSDYLVTIAADGTVNYEGYANVGMKGKVQTQISREKVALLVETFRKTKFFSLRDSYSSFEDCRINDGDAPSATTSITLNGKSKSVEHYLGCRSKRGSVSALFKVENDIDKIACTDQWVSWTPSRITKPCN
jgi:hypothetical protein